MDKEAVLLAVQGIITQCALAKQFYDGVQSVDDYTDEPIQAIYAAAATMRRMIEATMVDEEPEDGECPHPENKQEKLVMGAGHYAIVCHACDEIIAQV